MIPHPVQPNIAASPWLTQIAMLNVRRPSAVDHSPENWRRKPLGTSLAKSRAISERNRKDAERNRERVLAAMTDELVAIEIIAAKVGVSVDCVGRHLNKLMDEGAVEWSKGERTRKLWRKAPCL